MAFVTEFIDLYIFDKEQLQKKDDPSKIELEYTFKFKTSYDFEPEERWGSVSGKVEFDLSEEKVEQSF